MKGQRERNPKETKVFLTSQDANWSFDHESGGKSACGSHRYTENGEFSIELRRRLWEGQHAASNYEEEFALFENPHRIPPSQSFHKLTETEVFLAIAAVWRGLAETGHRYAFGDVAMFRNARLEKQAQATCVPRSKRFIMPLIFGNGLPNPPLNKKGAVAENNTAEYSILAAAEQLSNNGVTITIRLIFWYSKARDVAEAGASTATSPLSEGLIRRTAQSIVRNSNFSLGRKPIFDNENEEWRPVPDALVRGSLETSSYHLILHAWAYMLDIPIQAHHTREVNTMDD
ncbi:MAG: hypothetical protein Q9187_007974, partial [Circinaria calcarea]